MVPKVTSAIEILRSEGPVSLAKEVVCYLGWRTALGRPFLFRRTVEEVRRRTADEEDLDDILDTVLEVQPGYPPYQVTAQQLRDEIKALVTLVDREQPKRVLEIGTAGGGSLYIWGRYFESAQELVSLDLFGRKFSEYDEQKRKIFRTFAPSKEMAFVRGDSHQQRTYDEVGEVLSGEVDFLFIDGDHSYEGVKKDFEMYGQLVASGGIIALHDIVPHPNHRAEIERRREQERDIEEHHLHWGPTHPDCNVDQFWDELTEQYETEEIVSHPKQTWAGIGVVRLASEPQNRDPT